MYFDSSMLIVKVIAKVIAEVIAKVSRLSKLSIVFLFQKCVQDFEKSTYDFGNLLRIFFRTTGVFCPKCERSAWIHVPLAVKYKKSSMTKSN